MHAIALAAGELAHLLLLVAALEVEGADIGPRVHFRLAELENVGPARDFLPHRLVRLEIFARLIDIPDLHGVTDAQLPAVRFLLTGEDAEQGCLAGAIRADHADNTARR